MADLTPEETRQWLGRDAPNSAEIQAELEAAQKDPFGHWWRTFVEGKGVGANALAASGVGPNPLRTGNEAAAFASAANLQRDVRNAPTMDAIYRQGAGAGDRANPYNVGIADQSRGAQMALMAQMRGQMNGPSIAGMQGQRAMAQSGQQALMQGAMGNGRSAMLQSQGVAGGLAGDMGQARLAEVMRARAGIGGAAGSLRGGDLRSADAQMNTGLRQRAQDDAMRQFYASQGANLQNARLNAANNREQTRLQLLAKSNARDVQMVMDQGGAMANTLAMGAKGGKK